MDFTEDQGTLDALQFLMTREITHMKAFTAALESLEKPVFSIGKLPPTPGLVDQYFNDSTGIGQRGERDVRGPWNEGGSWEYVEAPAFKQFKSSETGERAVTNGTHLNGGAAEVEHHEIVAEKKQARAAAKHK
jgi:Mn-containing catalase